MQPERRLKQHKRYLFYRVFCPVVIVVWNVVVLGAFGRQRLEHDFPILLLPLVPFLVVAIFWFMNLMAFPWDYSVFGAYERTPLPTEPPVFQWRGSSGRLGALDGTAPLFSWYIYRNGVGVSLLGIGKAFIPFDAIVQLEDGSFFRGPRVTHSWPEVRGTLVLPHRKVLDALRDAMAKSVGGRVL